MTYLLLNHKEACVIIAWVCTVTPFDILFAEVRAV
jgi:hypothetical protein